VVVQICNSLITKTRSLKVKVHSQTKQANRFVNTWMHNGFVRVNEEKMSKSLGNFFTIREVLKVFDPEVVRFFILKAHYRSPLNYSDAHLEEAKQGLTRLYNALSTVEDIPTYSKPSTWRTRFAQVMNDDFNTPEAIAILFELAGEINKAEGPDKLEERRDLARELKQLAKLLGLLERPAQEFLQAGGGSQSADNDTAAIEAAIQARADAKQGKDFCQGRSDTSRLISPRNCSRRQAGWSHALEARLMTAAPKVADPKVVDPKAPVLRAPDYWDKACTELMKHDRIMRKLIPKYPKAEFLTTRERPISNFGTSHCGAADFRQGRSICLGTHHCS